MVDPARVRARIEDLAAEYDIATGIHPVALCKAGAAGGDRVPGDGRADCRGNDRHRRGRRYAGAIPGLLKIDAAWDRRALSETARILQRNTK